MVGRFGGQLFSRMILLIHLWTAVWKLKVLLWAPVKVWFYSVQGSYFILSRMGNKMIYQLDDLIKKTSWKSSRLISKCSNVALFCSQVSNSSRPWHRALIEGVFFRKCINAVYVIFLSYREGWYVMSKNVWKSVCVYTYKKGFPFKRLWDYKNTFFLPEQILPSIGHFHNNVILQLRLESIRVLPCCAN